MPHRLRRRRPVAGGINGKKENRVNCFGDYQQGDESKEQEDGGCQNIHPTLIWLILTFYRMLE